MRRGASARERVEEETAHEKVAEEQERARARK